MASTPAATALLSTSRAHHETVPAPSGHVPAEELTTETQELGQTGSVSLSALDIAPTDTLAKDQAMDRDEAGRMQVFSRLIVALALVSLALSPVLGGDPVARVVFFAAIAIILGFYGRIAWATRSPQSMLPRSSGWLFQLQALGGHGIAYYFGVFSPFPAIAALVLYVFALGSSVRNALLVYANIAVGQALLASLIIGDVIPNRGLVHTSYLSGGQQLAVALCVQMVFLVALLLGRMSRKHTVEAVSGMELAVREIARREALLQEARQALVRAEQGGPGRYTDQTMGSFRLGVVIGRGAMGEIYEAQHVATGAPAAVKLLHGDTEHRVRFIREVKVAASLSAPNLVEVLEIAEEAAPVPYLAMERLYGQDLGHILRERSTLPLAQVVTMVHQVSDGLEAARQARIVHRDLKPQNLFLARQGEHAIWKVLDFGISKLSTDDSSLTHGHVIGTPAYMAPEQATGAAVDHRADLYSLAVIAYRCMTGRPAFTGPQVPQILYQVVHLMPPRPSTLARVSAEVDAVLAVGMAKHAADRFASARELAAALTAAARGRMSADIRERAHRLMHRHAWGTTSGSATAAHRP